MTVQELCINAITKLNDIEQKMLKQEERIDKAFAEYKKANNELMKANEKLIH